MIGSRSRGRSAALAATFVLTVAGVVGATGGPAGAASLLTVSGRQQAAPYGTAQKPSIASNGTYSFVVWEEKFEGTSVIFGRFARADGTALGERMTIRYLVGKDATNPDVVWAKTRWVVVFEHAHSATDHDIYGVPVAYEGTVGQPFPIETNSVDQRRPAVASESDSIGVVYENGNVNDPTRTDIYIAYAWFTDLQVYDRARMSTDDADHPFSDREPDISGHGNFLVVWEAQGVTTSQIMWASDDYASHDFGVHTMISQDWYLTLTSPSITHCQFGNMVVFENQRGGQTGVDIWAYGWRQGQIAGDPPQHVVSARPGNEEDPVIACNGESFAIAWRDKRRGTAGDIYSTRLDQAGITDPNGLAVARTDGGEGRPAIAPADTDGNDFSLAWEETPAGQGSGVIAASVKIAPK